MGGFFYYLFYGEISLSLLIKLADKDGLCLKLFFPVSTDLQNKLMVAWRK